MFSEISFAAIIFSAIKLALVFGIAFFAQKFVTAKLANRPSNKYRYQLMTLAVALITLIMVIVVLPIDSETRGQLLSLTGILITAVIALSSTTYVGNVMAGAMLRTIKNCRPGDYIQIGEYFGRISELDLLHCEIQTEERDLVTLPNLYMVTNPMKMMRNSGTIVSVCLSLGYDVPRKVIEKALIKAAEEANLQKPYVQIVELGDFSVTYRISGLLKDLGALLATRRLLRACVLDQLHEADIEIVSPTFMNQRQYPVEKQFIPVTTWTDQKVVETPFPDDVVFDKAAKAESLEALRARLGEILENSQRLEAELKEVTKPEIHKALQERIEKLKAQADRWKELILSREAKLKEDD